MGQACAPAELSVLSVLWLQRIPLWSVCAFGALLLFVCVCFASLCGAIQTQVGVPDPHNPSYLTPTKAIEVWQRCLRNLVGVYRKQGRGGWLSLHGASQSMLAIAAETRKRLGERREKLRR